jgi:hypothetical protein
MVRGFYFPGGASLLVIGELSTPEAVLPQIWHARKN